MSREGRVIGVCYAFKIVFFGGIHFFRTAVAGLDDVDGPCDEVERIESELTEELVDRFWRPSGMRLGLGRLSEALLPLSRSRRMEL